MTKTLLEIITDLAKKTNADPILHIDANDFFKQWYYQNGKAYLFTFKNHLGVTDLQYAELYSLIKQYTTTDAEHNFPIADVLFHGSLDFKKTFQEIIDAFIEGSSNKDDIDWTSFTKLYSSILNNSVIIDARYGSCTLLLPPILYLKLSQVCLQSGYIDSCGIQIYAKRIDKTRSVNLIDRLSTYLQIRNNGNNKKFSHEKIKFGLWAHENSLPNEINEKGIEALKIYAHKVKIGNEKISTIVERIKSENEYLKKHLEFDINSEVETDGTIWIAQDRSVDYRSDDNHFGNKRYLLCYHQLFKNCNPLHIFNENKPAWVAPITIPHSLLGAMVNITRPWGQNTRLHDPFCGTGSLILEMLKDEQAIATGSDIAVESIFLLKDNISFLSDASILEANCDFLSNLIKCPFVLDNILANKNTLKFDADTRPNIKSIISDALNIFVKIIKDSKLDFKNGAVPEYKFLNSIKEFEKLSMKSRLVFYIALRAQKNKTDAHSQTCIFSDEFNKELKKLTAQFKTYQRWIDLPVATSQFPNLSSRLVKKTNNKFLQLSISPETLFNAQTLCESSIEIHSASNPDKYGDGTFDVIVTDPPYGFNTVEESLELAQLYNDFLKVWIKKIKPKGHLVICLPQETYNGQALPFCTNANLVTSTIISAAAEIGKQIIFPARVMPSYSPGLKPPYYWKSDKVLKRVVLHFQLDDRS